MAGENKERLSEKLDKELDAHIESMLEKNKNYRYANGFTEENFEEEMQRVPFFATTDPTPEDIKNSPEYQALQAMKYEDEDPHTNALAHKEDGNHHFGKKEYKKSIIAYTEALKRKHEDTLLYAILYTNRAAANFHLGNNRSALNDASLALTYKPDHVKAVIRCATCSFDLEIYDECIQWCEQGLQIDEKENKLSELKKKAAYQMKQQARDQRKAEMKQVKDLKKRRDLLDALHARIKLDKRGIEQLLISSSAPYSGKIYLDENKVLHWPLYFLYPEYNQSDFIEDFSENNCFQDHIDVVFESLPDWDVENKYLKENIEIYFEDQNRNKLVHVNSYIPLCTVLSDERYTIRGGCPAFMIFSNDSEFYKKYFIMQDMEEFDT